jgi:hypothetical protein
MISRLQLGSRFTTPEGPEFSYPGLFLIFASQNKFSTVVKRQDFYSGARLAPDWCATLLRKYGQNRYGENLFRIVMLTSRCKTVGGYWERDAEVSYKLMPKYGHEAKWALERFVPANVLGTPQAWEALYSTIEGYYAIGPFPVHGTFECVAVFSTGRGPNGYVPLEPGMIDLQARLVWMGRALTRYAIRAAALGEEEEKIRRDDKHFEKLLADHSLSRDVATFGHAISYSREQLVDDYKVKLIRSKAWLRKHRFTQGFSQGVN